MYFFKEMKENDKMFFSMLKIPEDISLTEAQEEQEQGNGYIINKEEKK